MNDRAVSRVEKAIKDVEKSLRDVESLLQRYEEGSYEHSVAQGQANKLAKKLSSLSVELDDLEGEW